MKKIKFWHTWSSGQGARCMVQGRTQVRILATAIYPYRGEIQFWSKLWKIPHRVEIWRKFNLVRALNPICRSANGASADRLIGMGARAHRPGCASWLRNGIPEREREQEPGTGTGTRNGNGKRNTEKITKRGEICMEIQFFRYFLIFK